MSEIAVFEDMQFVIDRIESCLEGTDHFVIAVARNIVKAHDLTRAIKDGDLDVGAVLLDGTLERGYIQPTFVYEFPELLAETKMQQLFRAIKGGRQPRQTVNVPPDNSTLLTGRDARQIAQIWEDLEIPVPLIGISTDSMSKIGAKVNHDLTKARIETMLPPLLDFYDTGVVDPVIEKLING